MKGKKPLRRHMFRSCEEIGAEDGADPRIFFRKPTRMKSDRKAMQLCGEVARTLSQVLAWESGDDHLRELVVVSVIPAPDSSRLLVTVEAPRAVEQAIFKAQAHLQLSCGRLRAEIAASVRRRRVPELTFRVVVRGEAQP
jgi:ribosome-binding factor A